MQKRHTAQDVAEFAGVSRTTVSFVLNNVAGMRISEETRQRVLDAARELNYHPDATARRMVKGRTSIIGFVLRQTPDQAFADHFLPQVLHGLSRAATAQGYHILIEPAPPDDSNSYLRLIRERHVDGIVLSGPRFDDQEQLRAYAESSPVVLMGQIPNTDLPFVDVDNVSGAAKVTQHLIDLGHRRIAFISNAKPAYTASADRLTGYRQALAATGIAFDECLVRYGDFAPASGDATMTELLQLTPRPTAVFVASDTVAIGALKAIRCAGLSVPRDMALVGFDDAPHSEFIEPPLTTVRLPAFGLGWGAADLLIRLINKEVIRQPAVLLETELIVRKSCGAHPL
ncbi:MAG TPA: LacI family DNA-binding transcriptional regulator [Anaerolineae bacterium]|nr:LacI family DNA-binding transcriptional regulator [Anaerolineae bacterium]